MNDNREEDAVRGRVRREEEQPTSRICRRKKYANEREREKGRGEGQGNRLKEGKGKDEE